MSSKGLVLITGANGYIAAQTVESFLRAGYSVRGTVRSKARAQSLISALAPEFGTDRLELVEVKDITVPGAFDEAIKGIDAVAHLASPVSMHLNDPEDTMSVAVNGTLRVLEAAIKEKTIKSFVLMSSIVAVLHQTEGDYIFTEKDWNTDAEEAWAKLGKDIPQQYIYSASKVLSERAFWKFVQDEKPGFTVSTVNPVFVSGPPVVPPSSPKEIGETYQNVWDVLIGKPLDQSGLVGNAQFFVDVRDVARMVLFAVQHPEKTDKERFIAVAGYAPQQGVADVLRQAYPERRDIIQEGKPGEGYYPDFALGAKGPSGDKMRNITGEEFIRLDKTVLDTAEVLKPALAKLKEITGKDHV